MIKYCVIKTGGKQYLVKENDEIIVDRMSEKEKSDIQLETLAMFSDEGDVEVGTPLLDRTTPATILEHLKGDKLYISKFKSKVRYRRRTGFRAFLTRIKIGTIN